MNRSFRADVSPFRTFVDLFAGLGGFHQAMARHGLECVFASEIDPELRSLYKANFGILPQGDIRSVPPSSIPDHDVLCGGFPCQSFSKAGKQKGLDCPTNGDLIDYLLTIIDVKKPRVFILENVPNLEAHDSGRTFARILDGLKKHYEVAYTRLSPHQFGIPQARERFFIVGALQSLSGFSFPVTSSEPTNLVPVLDRHPAEAKRISKQIEESLETWQEFIEMFPAKEQFPTFPIWAMEFGADYPIEGVPPYFRSNKSLWDHRGSFGQELSGIRKKEDLMARLPNYAHVFLEFPAWKRKFINQNRELYIRNKDWIDEWLPKIRRFPHSFQKLEWNCRGSERNIWNHLVQVRASGIRVKKRDVSPSLVAMTISQVPIVAWERRYMTPKECLRLQSMEPWISLPISPSKAFKALGNAVNVDLVDKIFLQLVRSAVSEKT